MGKLNTVQNGKTDKPRPIKDRKKYNENFDSIFRKKAKKEVAIEEQK